MAAFALAMAGLAFAQSVDPTKALADLQKTPLSKGPNGETPSPASSVTLTAEETAKIKEQKPKAAIVMHYAGNDWSQAQVAGLKEQFGKMGIEIIAVTDAGFKPEKQVADIETVLAQKPNIIVSIPTDPVATAEAYRKAAEQGVKLVFMDNVPEGTYCRQRVCQCRLCGQLWQRRRGCPPHGQGAEGKRQNRPGLPRG